MVISCPKNPNVSPAGLMAQLPWESPGPGSDTGDTEPCESSFPNPALEAEEPVPAELPATKPGGSRLLSQGVSVSLGQPDTAAQEGPQQPPNSTQTK